MGVLGLVILAFGSDCFAWYTESKGRPLADFIRAAFNQEITELEEAARREALASKEKALLPPADASLELPAPTEATAVAAKPATQLLAGKPAAEPEPAKVEAVAAVKPREEKAAASSGAATFGFYFPVFEQVAGTLNVVAMVRRHYPDSPIHLLQDGGATDFGKVCKLPKYNCTFEVVYAENSRWNPHSWLERMLNVAKRLRTTFLIYLEPDVIVRRRHSIEPKHDAGGMYDNYNSQTRRETVIYFERRGRERDPCFKVKWHHFGLAGGSYFRTEAILDSFDPSNVVRLDWAAMEKWEGHKVLSSDFAMLAALATRGWTVYPWEEASQKYDNIPTDPEALKEFRKNNPAWKPEAAFEHAHKEHYGDPIPEEEQRLVGQLPGGRKGLTTCHGCVWRSGPKLDQPMPIPSEIPGPADKKDLFDGEELKKLPNAAPCRLPGESTTPRPKRKKGEKYKETIYATGQECRDQATNFGVIQTVQECDKLTVSTEGCGSSFMFSKKHPNWACRCCAPFGEDSGPLQSAWDVYIATEEPSAKKDKPQKGYIEEDDEEDDAEPEVEPTTPPTPAPAAAGSGYTPVILHQGRECERQAKDLGFLATAKECDKAAAANNACGGHFMFSYTNPSWHCRCCTKDGADDGHVSEAWNVMTIQSTIPEARRPAPPKAVGPGAGLPVAEGPRPGWLVKEDGLVVDGRKKKSGGILILQAVLMDQYSEWGKTAGKRPRWLRSILATNRERARQFGHAMVLRWAPSKKQLTKWQLAACKANGKSKLKCLKENERENFNWEKHLMMAEYLNSPQNFSHVFMLDADAALVRADHDSLALMSQILEDEKKDVFLSDEDWLKYGEGRINGGLIFVKNTNFTRALFNDTFDAHRAGRPIDWRIGVKIQCTSNEQICLNALFNGDGKEVFRPKSMIASGKRFNRGGCTLHHCGEGGMTDPTMAELGMADPKLEIMHFMGGSKGTAADALCGEGARDLTGGGKEGYGCAERAP